MNISIMIRILISIAMFRLLLNGYRFLSTIALNKQYQKWVLSKDRSDSMLERKAEVISLWKHAGVSDASVPVVQPAGYGYVSKGNMSLFTNFPSLHEDMAKITVRSFCEAKGIYRSRMISSINPFDWVLMIIDLPKRILDALEIDAKKSVVNVLRFVWWVLGSFGSILLAFYPEEMKALFEKMVGLV